MGNGVGISNVRNGKFISIVELTSSRVGIRHKVAKSVAGVNWINLIILLFNDGRESCSFTATHPSHAEPSRLGKLFTSKCILIKYRTLLCFLVQKLRLIDSPFFHFLRVLVVSAAHWLIAPSHVPVGWYAYDDHEIIIYWTNRAAGMGGKPSGFQNVGVSSIDGKFNDGEKRCSSRERERANEKKWLYVWIKWTMLINLNHG